MMEPGKMLAYKLLDFRLSFQEYHDIFFFFYQWCSFKGSAGCACLSGRLCMVIIGYTWKNVG